MQTYLQNLLPRLQQYSQTLDNKELLIDQPWVLVDEGGNKQQYIFERDGKLIMSLNGNVRYGNWRYIPAARSLVIDRQTDLLLLNHAFFATGVCILKKDGFQEEPWMLVNQRIVPDLDVKRYLRSLLPENRNLRPLPVKGALLEYNIDQGLSVGTTVLDNEENRPVNGTFESSDRNNVFFDIQNGKITRVFNKIMFATDKGNLIIEKNWRAAEVQTGDFVKRPVNSIENGIYRGTNQKSDIKWIKVYNGRIVKARYDTGEAIVIITCTLAVIFIFLFIVFLTS
ncbi:hypothetical protein V9K67_21655 [Paraflavisolibacter sp. H34]|uniref:hypothetical protein n=1 Tax=Huijunlia imazamoxiresistens TaxID=3127457 RepID=UPI0030175B43